MPVEGFWKHVTTDGVLQGASDRRSACGWSVAQLDRGMYGTIDADLEAQRTIQRAKLTAFLWWSHHGSCCDKGIIDVLW